MRSWVDEVLLGPTSEVEGAGLREIWPTKISAPFPCFRVFLLQIYV
jgi:hypothetical protein